MDNKNESKIKSLIKKLEKQGYSLSDVTDKTVKQLTNNKAFEKFEKLVKRKLERKKIIEENKKYDEKVAKKIEAENEEIFKKFPWVKKVMKYDEKYQNEKKAKIVLERKLNEERLGIEYTLFKYINKKNKKLKGLLRDIKKETNINTLTRFSEVLEFIIQAYGEEEENKYSVFQFNIPEDELIEKVHSRFRIERLYNN